MPTSITPPPVSVMAMLLLSGLVSLGWAQDPADRRELGADSSRRSLEPRLEEDWPDFLGKRRDGKSAETGLNWDWTTQPPQVVWSRPLLGGYGIGSTAGGRFFQLDGDGDRSVLLCLNAETGEELWRHEYAMAYEDMYGFDNGPRASPVIDEDRVYTLGVEGMVHCFDAVQGQVLWSLDTTKRFHVRQNFFGVGSTPLVYRDLLLVMVGGSPAEGATSPPQTLSDVAPNGSGIVALDKRNGEIRYQTIDDLASYASPIVAPLNGRPTGLAFCREGLHAFRPESGEVLWFFPWRARKYESVNASTPVVTDLGILLTESYGPGGVLLRLVDGSPQVIWRDENIRAQRLSCHWCTPVVHEGFAYACHGEKPSQAELRCVELATGEVRWSQVRLGRCNLSYADGHLICLSEGGQLFAVRATPERFELAARWAPEASSVSLRPPCYAAPVISRGRLYLRDARALYCLEMRSNREE